jgi:hypothetical protein
MKTFTNEEKYKAADREVKQRVRVYGRLVSNGKMTQEKADLEIKLMEAIASDYALLMARDRLI